MIMDDLAVGNDTTGGTLQRWGAPQRALICQWQAGVWLLVFVSILALVMGVSPHDLRSTALLLASMAAGPYAIATLTKRLWLYGVAATCCWCGAAIALLPPLIVLPWLRTTPGRWLVWSRFYSSGPRPQPL